MLLQSISIAPKNEELPQGLIIFLHGWGANAYDLLSLSSELKLPHYQFEFPDAPFPHPYVPGGKMWYNLEQESPQELEKSYDLLNRWLLSLEEKHKIPRSKTILCGFSQGGAMALEVGLTLPLAGLIILSGYLHFQPEKPENPDHSFPPILMVHGRQDAVVPINAAQQAHRELERIGAPVEYQEFNMGHEISYPVINLIQSFIRKQMSKET